MNIQNIAALTEQVQLLGFENIGSSLLKRTCFKPDNFILLQRMVKRNDHLSFHLYFERNSKKDCYVLMYYDAVLQKEIALPHSIINGINTTTLENRMAEIDWKSAFEFDTKKPWSLEDKGSWEKEQKIEFIIEDLSKLESIEEGKSIAIGLKHKYWADIPFQELIGNMGPLKNKSDISQRFYLFEGQADISVDEAYRFLQNRWLEKQMQPKRVEVDHPNGDDSQNSSQASTGSGLLRKKNLSVAKKSKKKKLI